jgi:hypothetical protein
MAGMKPRHAAALALVLLCACSKKSKGWYLLVPPIEGATINKSAPVAKWEIRQSFDDAASCDASLDAGLDEARKSWLHPEIQKEPKQLETPARRLDRLG